MRRGEPIYKRYGPEIRQTKNYENLFTIYPLVKEFAPEPGRLYGPTIRILQVPAANAGPGARARY